MLKNTVFRVLMEPCVDTVHDQVFCWSIHRRFNGGVKKFRLPTKGKLYNSFCQATFMIMGKLAKAEGFVTRNTIEQAESMMIKMGLNLDQRKSAIHLFNHGKHNNFDLVDILHRFHVRAGKRDVLRQIFIETQLQVAYADGFIPAKKFSILQQIRVVLEIEKEQFDHIHEKVRKGLVTTNQGTEANKKQRESGTRRKQREESRKPVNGESSYHGDYLLLGVEPSVSDADLKRAYRRMMNQYHPDKLIAKAVSQSKIEWATEKTTQIKVAYERLKQSRKNSSAQI